jgi:glycosyltransferase involved in cell wall biosynthesis
MAAVPAGQLLKRFVLVARQEGLWRAWVTGFGYLKRRMLGQGASGLPSIPRHGPETAETYLHDIWQNFAQQGAFHITAAPAVLQRRRRIALIGDLNLPQCRKYRVEQLALFWRDRGVELEFSHYADVPRATRILQNATHLMEYRLKSCAITDMLRYEARRLRLPILYDLDDPLFSVSAYATYGNMAALDPALKRHFITEAPKYLSMMNGADILSVSTPGMVEHSAYYTPRPVYLRRNFADAETLDAGTNAMARRAPPDGIFRIAFASGSQGHEVDLAEIIAPLSDFILATPDRRLLALGHVDLAHFPAALHPRIEAVTFTRYPQYLAALARADCAVMPLCDDAFNQCKSAVRLLDAGAVGLPVIGSAVGDLPHVLRHGETGFVARSAQDWQGALETLCKDKAGAGQMGQAARKDMETHWRPSDQPHVISPEILYWVQG